MGRKAKKASKSLDRKSHKSLDPGDLNKQLRNLSLCTKDITGDGNCLFRSLSDQYFGTDDKHKLVRENVCQYLKENEETYRFFVEDDQSFEDHLENMQNVGTFGGNMELAAFAKLYEVDIKVYQPGLIYVIKGEDDEEYEEELRQTIHIAYHDWEHYSSVRNLNGPFTGPPEVKMVSEPQKEVTEEEEDNDEYDSKEKVVLNACPDVGIRRIRRLLRKHKGNPDKVIDALYEIENNSSETQVENDSEAVKQEGIKQEDVLKEDMIQNKIKEDDPKQKDTQKEDTTEDIKHGGTKENPMEKEGIENQEIKEKPKKLSASERKKQAKKKQKQAKLLKDQAKAARRTKREESTPIDVPVSQSMKEMFI